MFDSIASGLAWRARHQGSRLAVTFDHGSGRGDESVTYAELDARARQVAAAIRQASSGPGARVLLLYPPGIDYIAGFFGCLYAGAAAVPIYPPTQGASSRTLPRLKAIAEDANPELALLPSAAAAMAGPLFALDEALSRIHLLHSDALPPLAAGSEVADTRHELAFLQYTSGSTGAPKGVMVTQANLIRNLALIQEAFGHTRDDVGVIWLPPYHDMGLIGGILQPIFVGFPVTLMPPKAVVVRPFRWLERISRDRATISGGPDFAYALCLEGITEPQVETLDLSSWRVAFTGAERVRATTMRRFTQRFARAGFRYEAFRPVYGLAESTLMVTCGTPLTPPVITARGEGAPQPHGWQELVGCGAPREQVRVVDPHTLTECAGGVEGELWVSGPSIAQGYWRKEELSRATFEARLAHGEGPFLRTGDLGFVEGEQVFVSGRIKDLIILRGRNLHPPDLEAVAEAADPAVVPGGVAALAVEEEGREQLVVVAEVALRGSARTDERLEEVGRAIQRELSNEFEVAAAAVCLVGPRTLPRTSSGKLQRYAVREAWSQGGLEQLWTGKETALEPPSAEEAMSEVEARLARIWARVLGREAVRRSDNFFELGGDSIRCAQAQAQAAGEGLAFQSEQLFENPTVAALARVVRPVAPEAARPSAGHLVALDPQTLQRAAAQLRLPKKAGVP